MIFILNVGPRKSKKSFPTSVKRRIIANFPESRFTKDPNLADFVIIPDGARRPSDTFLHDNPRFRNPEFWIEFSEFAKNARKMADSYDGKIQKQKDGSFDVVLPSALVPPSYISPGIVQNINDISSFSSSPSEINQAKRKLGFADEPTSDQIFNRYNFQPTSGTASSKSDERPGPSLGNTVPMPAEFWKDDPETIRLLKNIPITAEQATSLLSVPDIGFRSVPIENGSRKRCPDGVQFDVYSKGFLVTRIVCEIPSKIVEKLFQQLNLVNPISPNGQFVTGPNGQTIQYSPFIGQALQSPQDSNLKYQQDLQAYNANQQLIIAQNKAVQAGQLPANMFVNYIPPPPPPPTQVTAPAQGRNQGYQPVSPPSLFPGFQQQPLQQQQMQQMQYLQYQQQNPYTTQGYSPAALAVPKLAVLKPEDFARLSALDKVKLTQTQLPAAKKIPTTLFGAVPTAVGQPMIQQQADTARLLEFQKLVSDTKVKTDLDAQKLELERQRKQLEEQSQQRQFQPQQKQIDATSLTEAYYNWQKAYVGVFGFPEKDYKTVFNELKQMTEAPTKASTQQSKPKNETQKPPDSKKAFEAPPTPPKILTGNQLSEFVSYSDKLVEILNLWDVLILKIEGQFSPSTLDKTFQAFSTSTGNTTIFEPRSMILKTKTRNSISDENAYFILRGITKYQEFVKSVKGLYADFSAAILKTLKDAKGGTDCKSAPTFICLYWDFIIPAKGDTNGNFVSSITLYDLFGTLFSYQCNSLNSFTDEETNESVPDRQLNTRDAYDGVLSSISDAVNYVYGQGLLGKNEQMTDISDGRKFCSSLYTVVSSVSGELSKLAGDNTIFPQMLSKPINFLKSYLQTKEILYTHIKEWFSTERNKRTYHDISYDMTSTLKQQDKKEQTVYCSGFIMFTIVLNLLIMSNVLKPEEVESYINAEIQQQKTDLENIALKPTQNKSWVDWIWRFGRTEKR